MSPKFMLIVNIGKVNASVKGNCMTQVKKGLNAFCAFLPLFYQEQI